MAKLFHEYNASVRPGHKSHVLVQHRYINSDYEIVIFARSASIRAINSNGETSRDINLQGSGLVMLGGKEPNKPFCDIHIIEVMRRQDGGAWLDLDNPPRFHDGRLGQTFGDVLAVMIEIDGRSRRFVSKKFAETDAIVPDTDLLLRYLAGEATPEEVIAAADRQHSLEHDLTVMPAEELAKQLAGEVARLKSEAGKLTAEIDSKSRELADTKADLADARHINEKLYAAEQESQARIKELEAQPAESTD